MLSSSIFFLDLPIDEPIDLPRNTENAASVTLDIPVVGGISYTTWTGENRTKPPTQKNTNTLPGKPFILLYVTTLMQLWSIARKHTLWHS